MASRKRKSVSRLISGTIGIRRGAPEYAHNLKAELAMARSENKTLGEQASRMSEKIEQLEAQAQEAAIDLKEAKEYAEFLELQLANNTTLLSFFIQKVHKNKKTYNMASLLGLGAALTLPAILAKYFKDKKKPN